MKFKMEHKFDCPVEKVITLLCAGEEICNMEDLPNVTTRKVLERSREGKRIYSRVEWNVHGQMPKVAQKFVNPKRLTFIENTAWDDNKAEFTTTITPSVLKSKIKCQTKSAWVSEGENRSKHQFEGTISIELPVIGKVLEKTVVRYLRKNYDQNAAMMSNCLEEKLG